MTDEFSMNVKELAVGLLERAEDDQAARLAILQAAAMLIAAIAIEHDDTTVAIEEMVADIHTEAWALADLVLSGRVDGTDELSASEETLQ